MDNYKPKTELEEKIYNLEISVIDGWVEETYDVYLGNKRVLTDAPEQMVNSYIMKHQRKLESLVRHNQRSLDYVNRWKQLASERASEPRK